MPREFASGIQHAEVATLPAASANPRVTLSQGGKLWWSDGANWIDLGAAAQLGTATPAALGTAAPGAASAASREDHVHPMPTAAQVGAAPTSHTHTASQISDSTAAGRTLLTAADAAAQRSALGLGTAATHNEGSGNGLDADLLDGVEGANYLASRGAVADTALDSATLNGFYTVNYTGESRSLLTWNAGGSSGPVQIEHHFTGQLRFRNRTDGTTWTAWRNLWHDGNLLNIGTTATSARTALGLGTAATSALSTTNAAALGTAAPGSETTVARADHVHPMPTAAQVGADPAGTGASQAAAAVNARIPAGTTTGRYARWNNTAARWEEFDLLGAANTWSGNSTFTAQLSNKAISGSTYVRISKAGATDLAGIWFGNELSVNRWILATDSTTDDNLQLIRYDDAGNFLDTPLHWSSSTGIATFNRNTIFLGAVGVGTTPATSRNLDVGRQLTGSNSPIAVMVGGQIQPDATTVATYVRSLASTQAASFTVGDVIHFWGTQSTFGAGSTVNNQTVFWANASNIGAINNYGFRGSIPSGTGRWNLFMDGTASNFIQGSLGIGTTSLTGFNLRVEAPISGAANSQGIHSAGAVQAGVTTGSAFRSVLGVAAGAAPANVIHMWAGQAAFAGTATNQYGFYAGADLVGATNNYGAWSGLSAGSGRWNFFAEGTANNAFAGNTRFGSTAAPTVPLDVTGNAIISGTLTVGGNVMSAVQAGTATGQFARWNQTTGRYEPFDLLGTANDWIIATTGQTLADGAPVLAVITTTQNFPLPASPTAGDRFVVGNARGSTAGALVRVQTNAGQQIIGAAVGDDVTVAPGETIHLVARSASLLEIV